MRTVVVVDVHYSHDLSSPVIKFRHYFARPTVMTFIALIAPYKRATLYPSAHQMSCTVLEDDDNDDETVQLWCTSNRDNAYLRHGTLKSAQCRYQR